MKKTNVKYIRNGIQYNSADNVIPVPKYKSPPPRGKKRVAVTNIEPDVEMFEREETPERTDLLPNKRISINSRLKLQNDVTNYQYYKNTVSSSYKFGNTGKRGNGQEIYSPSNLSMYSQNEEAFAEKMNKFTVRDFSNNTRMNIKNVEYAN